MVPGSRKSFCGSSMTHGVHFAYKSIGNVRLVFHPSILLSLDFAHRRLWSMSRIHVHHVSLLFVVGSWSVFFFFFFFLSFFPLDHSRSRIKKALPYFLASRMNEVGRHRATMTHGCWPRRAKFCFLPSFLRFLSLSSGICTALPFLESHHSTSLRPAIGCHF